MFNDKEYPLDVEELSLGKYGLEQLQWATNLKRLTVTLTEPVDWALLLAIPTLEHLEIAFHGSKTDLLLADLPVSEKLTELTLTARGSFGTVVLPKTEQLKQLTVVSFGKTEKLDVSRCTGLQVLNVSAAVEQLELGLGPEKLFLDDAVFTPKMLPAAVRIREMSLTVPQDLSILKHCPQIKKLSLAVRDPALAWDLTMLKDSAVEQLSVGDCTTQMLSDLSNMEFLQILQISDRNVEDLTALTAMSSLQKLVLTVDPDQPAEVFEALRGRELGPADLDLLQQLKLNIPPQQLADFLQAGKTLVLFHDISRY